MDAPHPGSSLAASAPAGSAAAVHVPAAARAAGPTILLVEDNPVNREVALGLLESLGCATDAAENGWMALRAMNTATYDAVVDGLPNAGDGRADGRYRRNTTARTGLGGRASAHHRADRECHGRGTASDVSRPEWMTSSSKPFTQQQLATLLRRWLALRALPETERRDLSRIPLIDAGVLRNIAALAKPALLNSMIDLYLQHSPDLVGAIETAAANMQPEALSQAVHTLKSSTSNLGGTRLAMVAKECEALVREGAITQVAPIVSRIRKEHQEFCAALTRERSSNAA